MYAQYPSLYSSGTAISSTVLSGSIDYTGAFLFSAGYSYSITPELFGTNYANTMVASNLQVLGTNNAPITITANEYINPYSFNLPSGVGTSGQVLATSVNGSTTNTYWTTVGNGTVTSVSGTGTVSGLTLTGTVTTSGNLTLGGTLAVTPSNFSSQTANTFLAAPNGSSGTPTFRTIVAADVPTLNQNTTGTAANITATSNSTLTTLSALSLLGSQVSGNISGQAGTVATINGKIAAGSNITISGSGTSASPYTIASSAGGGTVTSVTFTGDGTVLSATPSSAVTTSGTVTATLNTVANNYFLAGPTSGGPLAPTYRSITAADIPTLNQNTTGTAANITATSNTTLTTLNSLTSATSLSLATSQLTGTISTSQIAANAVTYAKMQSETASTLLGNPTGSGAAPSEITLGSGLSFSGTTLTATGGSPGGSNTMIQFNNSGSFGGSANLEWDGTNLITASIVAPSATTLTLSTKNNTTNTSNVTLQSGNVTSGNHTSGNVTVTTGTTGTGVGSSGNILISTADGVNGGKAGSITLTAGADTTGSGSSSDITINASTDTAGGSGRSGNIILNASAVGSTPNGQIQIVDYGVSVAQYTSALLSVQSTTRGFLPPVLTTTQKNAISSPAAGLIVYDTTLHGIYYYNGSAWTSTGGGSGTVTSVGFTDASTTPIYTITGSPVTTSGTLTQTLSTQTANTVFAGPSSGSAAQPTFRSLVSADIPSSIAANTSGQAGSVATISGLVTAGSNITITGSGTSGSPYSIASSGGGGSSFNPFFYTFAGGF